MARTVRQVGQDESREHDERLEHLRQEAQSGSAPASTMPPRRAPVLARAQGGVRRAQEKEDEHRVRVVVAEHEGGDRSERKDQAGQEGRHGGTGGPRTVAWSRATDATPSKACGTSTLHDDSPNNRTLAVIGHSANGGLSTVIAPAGSSDPKNIAFHDSAPDWAAAE